MGDSHTARMGFILRNYFEENVESEYAVASDQNYNTKTVDENGFQIYMKDSLMTYEDNENKFYLSAHPGRSALNYNFETFASGTQKDELDKWNSDDVIFMPWLGYIDIRNHLPQKDLKNYIDVKGVVTRYIDNVLNKFNKAKVIFIEPVPQFITIVTSHWRFNNLDPDIPFEDRHTIHLEFVEELRRQCAERGLSEPVNVREILGTDMIESWMQPKKPIMEFLNDHMTGEHYAKILDHIHKNIS